MRNPHLEMLKSLQSILMRMHRMIMTSQKTDFEMQTGKALNPAEWMHMMITEPQFAWMKSMLTLISDIDALMDNYTVTEKELEVIRQDSELLFMPSEGQNQDFYSEYLKVAQKDPDVILFHGQLRSKILSLPKAHKTLETKEIRRNWHVKASRSH